MLSPEQVSAVIITKGNVDLTPVLDSLIFDDIIVWDNSWKPLNPRYRANRRPVPSTRSRDEMTYARVLAVKGAKHRVIYSQDDDIIHSDENQLRIISSYRPGVMTGCMWQEWSDGAKAQGIEHGYEDLVFAGSGSVYDSDIPAAAALRYLDHYPLDDFFRLWADTIIGILAPTRQLDIRFEALPHAEAPDRMCNLPNANQLKAEAIRRARSVRDQKWDAHAHYLMEQSQGRHPESRYL